MNEKSKKEGAAMKPKMLLFYIVLALVILAVLFTYDFLSSWNPVKWLGDSINGFFNWIFNLFFGWLPKI